jgi:hypothetical protein
MKFSHIIIDGELKDGVVSYMRDRIHDASPDIKCSLIVNDKELINVAAE